MGSNIQYYHSNPRLKAENVNINFTPEQILEMGKCRKDPEYFIKTYIKVVHVDKGLVDFDLYDYQKDMIKAFHEKRWVILKTARQSGKSVTTLAYILWYILFNDMKKVAILANKATTARELLGRLQLAYEHLPVWLQQGVVSWNKGSIMLENGCEVLASSTSGAAIRGFSVNLLMLDEFAFVPNNIADEFFTSVYPTISSGMSTKVFVISTPCGMNHFYKLWTQAELKENDYFPIAVHWSQVPGRDAKWAEDTKRNMGETRFIQEMDAEFMGSTHTLINPRDIKNMTAKKAVYIDKDNAGLVVYKMPEIGRIYVVSVDVAHGKGLDYSAAQVIDITSYPFEQVARYKNNEVSILMFPLILDRIGRMFNDAEMLIETNDAGISVANALHYDIEYPNVSWIDQSIGVKTTKATKYIGCSNLKQLIEDQKLPICDFETIQEISTFALRGRTYQADQGCNDDLVMALVNFAWFSTTQYFRQLTDKDIQAKLREEKEKMIQESYLPMLVSGNSDEDDEDEKFDNWLKNMPQR